MKAFLNYCITSDTCRIMIQILCTQEPMSGVLELTEVSSLIETIVVKNCGRSCRGFGLMHNFDARGFRKNHDRCNTDIRLKFI